MNKRWCLLAMSCCVMSATVSAENINLTFDVTKYQSQTVTVDNKAVKIRAYENIIYVKNPVDSRYQRMNIYIPEDYFHGRKIGMYSAQTAPIFLPNQIGGYMPAQAGVAVASDARQKQGSQTIAAALAHGYVVATPGARGRTGKNDNGLYTGKAPAAIVDLKAAVRYLHANDAVMPGDAHKIIANGTSAGGALSALLGASGNSKDYQPYLQQLGAAEAADDIFAVSAYCPITNLEHADSAYEWQFNQVYQYKKIDISMLDYHVQRKETEGTLDAAQRQVAKDLQPLFPQYVNGLHLKDWQGQPLQLDAQGNGTFKDFIKRYIMLSAQQALNNGADLSAYHWLTVRDNIVTNMDFTAYNQAVSRAKTPPAFDALDLSAGENQLFGTANVDKLHFTDYGKNHSVVKADMASSQIVKMMNPMNYLNRQHGVAKYWRIRQGTRDRDTSLAIPTILALALQNTGHNVDFALPWDKPHSGDYDLSELFAWIDQISHAQ